MKPKFIRVMRDSKYVNLNVRAYTYWRVAEELRHPFGISRSHIAIIGTGAEMALGKSNEEG